MRGSFKTSTRSRSRGRRIGLAALPLAAMATATALWGPGAAADPDLENRIESARSEAQSVEQRIAAQTAQVGALSEQARQAGAREMQLQAEIERITARSAQLASQLAQLEDQLAEVQARLKRAIAVLSERLVEIYKGSEPDYLTVVLEADGFDDLASRTELIDALRNADQRLAERVRALRDEVQANRDRIAALKAQIDEQGRRLDAARDEAVAARAEAEGRMAELERARAAQQELLQQVEGDIAGLEEQLAEQIREQQAVVQQPAGAPAFEGGPYSIPTYIMMCESGGNYAALNPSSGAGGAYQILPSTWRAYGGRGLPHQASKAEQDRIAALIWADVGPSAWSCA
jgi:peptidoglycan hydrolase CwlO-like protein